MSEKKVFVITMCKGSYGDISTEVIGITDDYNAGLNYVNEKNLNFKKMSEKAKNFYEKKQVEWIIKNPRPLIKYPLMTIPVLTINGYTQMSNLKNTKQLTEEMKLNRKKLELKKKEILEENKSLMKEWGKKLESFSTDYFKANLTKEEYEIYLINNDNYWSIEETKWFKF